MNSRSWIRDSLNIILLLGISFAAFLRLGAADGTLPTFKQSPTGTVKEMRGQVQLRKNKFEAWSQVGRNTEVVDGMSIYTGEESSLTFSLTKSEVSLNDETLIQVIDPDKRDELKFGFGSFSLKSAAGDFFINAGSERIRLSLSESKASLNRDAKGKTSIKSDQGKLVLYIAGKSRVLEEGQSIEFDLPDGGIARSPASEEATEPAFDIQPAVETPEPPKLFVSSGGETPPPVPTPKITGTEKVLNVNRKTPERFFSVFVGPSYVNLVKSNESVDSTMTGLSGPTVEFGAYHALTDQYALEFSYLESRNRAQGEFDGQTISRNFKFREQRFGVSRKLGQSASIQVGLNSQETPLLVDTETDFKVVHADSTSGYVGGAVSRTFWDIATKLDLKIALPITSSSPTEIENFRSSLMFEGRLSAHYCLTDDLSITGAVRVSHGSSTYNGQSQDDASGVRASFLYVAPMIGLISGNCQSPRNLNN